MAKGVFVIAAHINNKLHYLSETMKIFNGKLAPGLNKNLKEAITFESETEAQTTLDNIRDMHNRKFFIAGVETDSKKTFAAYTRQQKEKELN